MVAIQAALRLAAQNPVPFCGGYKISPTTPEGPHLFEWQAPPKYQTLTSQVP
jgi:hypothetical protein